MGDLTSPRPASTGHRRGCGPSPGSCPQQLQPPRTLGVRDNAGAPLPPPSAQMTRVTFPGSRSVAGAHLHSSQSPHTSVTLTGGRSRSGPGRKAGHRQRKRPLAPCTRPKPPTLLPPLPLPHTPFHYQLGHPFSRKCPCPCPGPRGQGVPPGVTQHRPQSPALGPAQGGRD